MMDHIKQITYFFKFSESRLKILRKNVANHSSSPSFAHIIDVCNTRWVERIVGLGVFYDLFEGILSTFEEMSANVTGSINSDTVSKAVSHRNALERFEFLIALVITKNVFEMTMEVTQLLQARTNDMFKTMMLIESLKDEFTSIRNNVDQRHGNWFADAESLATRLNITVGVPRLAKRQINRPNYSHSDVSDYFKKAITIPLLDHVISELNDRFDHSLTPYHGLVVISSRLLFLVKSEQKDPPKFSWKDQFQTFVNFYRNDFPNPSAISNELDIWVRYWQKVEKDDAKSVPNSIEATLKSFPHSENVFTNIQVMLRILATIPMTSCECERSFSAMRRLKNYSRSTMTENRLNGLALMHIHLGIKIDKENIINRFASKGPRKLEFI